MNKDDPFEQILSQLNGLMKIFQKVSFESLNGKLTPDLELKVTALAHDVEWFCSLNKEIVQSVTPRDQAKQMAMFEKNSDLSRNDQRILQKLERIKSDLEVMKKNFLQEVEAGEGEGSITELESKAENAEAVTEVIKKNKLKALGRHKNWMPL